MLGARWINLFCGEIDIALAMHSPRPPLGPCAASLELLMYPAKTTTHQTMPATDKHGASSAHLALQFIKREDHLQAR